MILVVRQKVSFTEGELNTLTNVAYVTLMASFVFNIISMIMGSYILWTSGNPFGIILFFGIVAFCASCWILRPFWKMTVRQKGTCARVLFFMETHLFLFRFSCIMIY